MEHAKIQRLVIIANRMYAEDIVYAKLPVRYAVVSVIKKKSVHSLCDKINISILSCLK